MILLNIFTKIWIWKQILYCIVGRPFTPRLILIRNLLVSRNIFIVLIQWWYLLLTDRYLLLVVIFHYLQAMGASSGHLQASYEEQASNPYHRLSCFWTDNFHLECDCRSYWCPHHLVHNNHNIFIFMDFFSLCPLPLPWYVF